MAETGQSDNAANSINAARMILERLARESPTIAEYQHRLAGCHNNMGRLLWGTGRHNDALQSCRAALMIQERLVLENPTVARYQRELIATQNTTGILLRATGRPDEALKAYAAAMKAGERLVRENPAVTDFQFELAKIHVNTGVLLRATGQRDLALQEFTSALRIQDRLARDHPTITEYDSSLGVILGNLAEFDMDLRAWTEAREKLRLAVAHQRASITAVPGNLAYLRALKEALKNLSQVERWMDNVAGAMRAARELGELSRGDATMIYHAACGLVQCIPIIQAGKRAELADEAMKTLRAAVTAGWSDAARTAQDPTLAPLRGREDFEHLLAELFDRHFPTDPIARP